MKLSSGLFFCDVDAVTKKSVLAIVANSVGKGTSQVVQKPNPVHEAGQRGPTAGSSESCKQGL